ncbi:hypothetical protein C474_00987 [Halogeometricum pallidum JCM 14848]|uniref:Uncharacterized protein n=1 Tax=Halogeometricum pallidum JCM 14848 TaxID=1227487 RepID=M0DJK6_HALPD|nr:hypothetical protein [Halogeometricum pallidum]ELZ34892.1 hypothetical protein C474_00987 [Halogeometricum pallidum JCM 14848]
MGDKSFTLFEINLHEPNFSASNSAPGFVKKLAEEATETDEGDEDGGGLFQSISVTDGDAEDSVGDDEDDTDVSVDDELEDIETDDDTGSSGRGKGSTIIGLLLLAGFAVAKKLMSGDDIDELAELDDLTDISVGDVTDTDEAVEEAEDAVLDDDADEESHDVDADAESSGRSKSGILVALVLLGALLVAKKLMSGDDEFDELDDLSDTDDESHDAALNTDDNDEAATSIVDDEETDAGDDDDHDAVLDEDDEHDDEQ